jgi:hypothetical protein
MDKMSRMGTVFDETNNQCGGWCGSCGGYRKTWSSHRHRKGASLCFVKVQTIKVMCKVEECAMRMNNKLACLSGNSKLEAFFEVLVILNVKNIPTFVFPRIGELFNKGLELSHFGSTHAWDKYDVDNHGMM